MLMGPVPSYRAQSTGWTGGSMCVPLSSKVYGCYGDSYASNSLRLDNRERHTCTFPLLLRGIGSMNNHWVIPIFLRGAGVLEEY